MLREDVGWRWKEGGEGGGRTSVSHGECDVQSLDCGPKSYNERLWAVASFAPRTHAAKPTVDRVITQNKFPDVVRDISESSPFHYTDRCECS
jgi:hypothetical protein